MKYTQLPENYIENMKELLGKEAIDYFNSFDEERHYGLRINTKKISVQDFQNISPFSLNPVSWIPNGFYYPESDKPSKDVYYYAGLYYLQEPSAMTPAYLLPVVPGDRVLDLCAAPGGKSTELGAKLKGQGLLVANDISNSRAKALLKNLELFGISNICVTSESPETLSEAFPETFNKILVDAPCSGEGMFRKDSDMVKSWLEHGPEYYAPIQKSILESAVKMLNPGGLLLYSTCTFSPVEDEDVIRWVLSSHPELELVPLPLFSGACDGIGLSGCLRLFPHKLKGEGHFLAMLKKKEKQDDCVNYGINFKQSMKLLEMQPITLPDFPELENFLSHISSTYDPERLYLKQNMVYYIPEDFIPRRKLRFLRTGLLLGELKKGRFEPSQAFAMSLPKGCFTPCISLSHDDLRVIRYLKGETLTLTDAEAPIKGWCLTTVDGFALGFAKGSGSVLKNKYYPGWRWQ